MKLKSTFHLYLINNYMYIKYITHMQILPTITAYFITISMAYIVTRITHFKISKTLLLNFPRE